MASREAPRLTATGQYCGSSETDRNRFQEHNAAHERACSPQRFTEPDIRRCIRALLGARASRSNTRLAEAR